MNYARLADWVRERVEDLVDMGVPRQDAERMLDAVQVDAVNSEARARQDRQFLLDLQAIGTRALAEKRGVSVQAINKRRQKIIDNQNSNLRLSA